MLYPDRTMLPVPGDGDCLATSLKLALGLSEEVAELRSFVRQALKMDPRLNSVRQMLLDMDTFEKTLQDVKTPGAWLGEEFLQAMVVLYQVAIHLETPSGLRIVGDETLTRFVLLAYNGVHYSPLVPTPL